MPPKKRSRTVNLVHFDPKFFQTEEVSCLDNYEAELGKMEKDSPGAKILGGLSRILSQLRDACHAPDQVIRTTIAATSIDTEREASEFVNIDFQLDSEDYMLDSTTAGFSSDGKLSAWADEAIAKIRGSKYFQKSKSESMARIIIDILFCDRLNLLQDRDAKVHLNWLPEVSIVAENHEISTAIVGRADWVLAHNPRSPLDSTLVVLEAKKRGAVGLALPQLIIYLAAIQDGRKKAGKTNTSVFGVMSDSITFIFCFLTESRKLFTSRPFIWSLDKLSIVKWIDKVLENAIRASPHISPVKGSRITSELYQAEIRQWLSFGRSLNDPALVEYSEEEGYSTLDAGGLLVYRTSGLHESSDEENEECSDGELV